MDYENWAAAPGMEHWSYATACRTSGGWNAVWRPRPTTPYLGATDPLLLERGPAASPLHAALFDAVRQAGSRSPTTSTAHDRRGSLRSTGTSTPVGGCQLRARTCIPSVTARTWMW